MVALMAARLGPVPDIPGAPPGLVAVLRRAMAHDPADRPADIAVFRDALAEADLSSPSGAAPAYWPGPAMDGARQEAGHGPDARTEPPATEATGRRGGLSGPPLAAA